MRLTVIGMWGGFPKENGPTSGYLLEQGEEKILIDCGSGVLMKLQEYANLNDIHQVLLSHYHDDHACDAGAFTFSRLVNTQLERVKQPLTIYGPNNADKKQQYQAVPNTIFTEITENIIIKIGSFELSFLQTVHSVETYAISVQSKGKKLVYTADTSYTEKLIPFAKNADLLLAEASLYDGMDGAAFGHMTSSEAALLGKKANVDRLILTHLPHYGDVNELLDSAKNAGIADVQLAEVGMVMDI